MDEASNARQPDAWSHGGFPSNASGPAAGGYGRLDAYDRQGTGMDEGGGPSAGHGSLYANPGREGLGRSQGPLQGGGMAWGPVGGGMDGAPSNSGRQHRQGSYEPPSYSNYGGGFTTGGTVGSVPGSFGAPTGGVPGGNVPARGFAGGYPGGGVSGPQATGGRFSGTHTGGGFGGGYGGAQRQEGGSFG